LGSWWAAPSPGRVERIAGTGELDDISALAAEMGYGGGFDFAADGSLYIADNTHSRVRRVDPEGVISTVLGLGEIGFDRDGHGPKVGLSSPERVVVDEARGCLLVVDADNSRIGALDLDVFRFTVAGTGAYEDPLELRGRPLEMSIWRPAGLELSPEGDLLIAERAGHRVLRWVGAEAALEP